MYNAKQTDKVFIYLLYKKKRNSTEIYWNEFLENDQIFVLKHTTKSLFLE